MSSSTANTRWSANCYSTAECDGWNKGRWCAGTCSSIPSPSPAPTPTPSPADWELIWSDEFNACPNGRPDPANWGYEYGYKRNNEQQWYQADNAACVDGHLVITSRRERPAANPSFEYTASSLITKDKQEFGYGRYEMRGKIPIELGSWPAWWTLGLVDGLTWPNNGEVDIMEFYRGKVLANFLYANNQSKAVWNSRKIAVDDVWASEFHVWAMEWDESELKIILDNEVVNTQRVSSADGTGHANPYRDHKWYMLINQAIGGSSGGDPSGTAFPLKYEVDYVRFYQRKSSIV